MNDLNDIFQFNYILNLVNIIMGHTLARYLDGQNFLPNSELS